MNRTVYISHEVWERAKLNAKLQSLSTSAYISKLIMNDNTRRERILSHLKKG